MSYLTDSEIEALQASGLSRETPYMICGVSRSQLSIARYYGAAKYNGQPYTYFADSDELVRDDVLKFVAKLRKPKKRASKSK